jgi:threonine synthase
VKSASGVAAPLPPRMADLYHRPERVTRVANDLSALQAVIKDRIKL